jgi:hypothetical protein
MQVIPLPLIKEKPQPRLPVESLILAPAAAGHTTPVDGFFFTVNGAH